jgi:hypothetical protein
MNPTFLAANDSGVGIAEDPAGSDRALLGALPNPFTTTTTIRYELPTAGNVNLRVYDATGRLVASLAEGTRTAGRHETDFSPAPGSENPGGVYFTQLTVNVDGTTWTETTKLVMTSQRKCP